MAKDLGKVQASMVPLSLPLFMNARNKVAAIPVTFLATYPIYLATNHMTHKVPAILEFTLIDRLVPFLPGSVWIYMSENVLYLAIYFIAKKRENLNRYLYALFATYIVANFIFYQWPVAFPREQFPLPTDINPWTYGLFAWLRTVDTPQNCLPSLHVASTYLTCFLFLEEQRKYFLPFFLWGTAIAISTMTTKQHYFVDVVAGAGLSILIHWIFFRVLPAHATRFYEAN